MAQARSTHSIHCALAKHVERFCDKDANYSPHTVAQGLEKIHAPHSGVKGELISTFNASHSSDNIVCPVTGARFIPDEKKGYAATLHLGTTRIWNPDGSINEDRWNKFVQFVTEGQEDKTDKVVTQSKVKAYLAKCYQDDPQEADTGRNTHALFSSKFVQGTAATAAWDEVFDRLTCGWHVTNGAHDPFINLQIVRLFFEDSTQAFQAAEDNVLPVHKPDIRP